MYTNSMTDIVMDRCRSVNSINSHIYIQNVFYVTLGVFASFQLKSHTVLLSLSLFLPLSLS